MPGFPLIPAYSRSESRSHLDFLEVRSGFEPEGRGLRATFGREAIAAFGSSQIPLGVPASSTAGSLEPVRDLEPRESAEVLDVPGRQDQVVDSCYRRDLTVRRGRRPAPFPESGALPRMPARSSFVVGKNRECASPRGGG